MNAEEIFNKFSRKRVLVLGDVMIDAYLRGSVNRISPEAPVPIVNLKKSEERLGGAANVALNLLALGAEPILCSLIGNDIGGGKFERLLDKRGLTSEGIVISNSRTTTVKTRVIGNNQHLIRIDEEETENISEEQESLVFDKLKEIIRNGVDAMIIEDYNKGLLTENLIAKAIAYANENDVIITVDPKKDNFFAYKNVTLFKPNLKELKEGLNVDFDIATEKGAFEDAVSELEKRLQNEISFVTLSEHGVYVKDAKVNEYIPAHFRNIADVSGAGDTVISVATLCLVAGLSSKEVAAIANLAGGLVCERIGVVPIDKDLLKREVQKTVMA